MGSRAGEPPWLDALVTQGVEAVVVFDDAFVLRYANREAADLLGYALGDLEGRNAFDLVHPDDQVRAAANVTGLHGGARPDPGLLRLRRGDGTWSDYSLRPRRIHLPPPPDGPGDVTAVAVRDNSMEDAQWTFLAQLASGADFHQSLQALTRGSSSPVDGPMGVGYQTAGIRHIAGLLPEALVWPDVVVPGSPWAQALASGDSAHARTVDLPDPARAVAEHHGIGAVVVVPVVDPAHHLPALLVQGPAQPEMGEILHNALTRRPREALTIALERRHAMEQLHLAAFTDPLTGLANRTRFFDALAEVEGAGADYAVCYVDLDRFKAVNDDHGHLVGDHLLVACAERLRAACGRLDVVARLGGDEFGVVVVGAGYDAVGRVADCLVDELARPVVVGGRVLDLGASVGVALGRAGLSGDEVVAAADTALYAAKRAGRGVWRMAEVGEPSLPFGEPSGAAVPSVQQIWTNS